MFFVPLTSKRHLARSDSLLHIARNVANEPLSHCFSEPTLLPFEHGY